VPWVTRCRKLP
jgi:hypothetical protein